MKVLQIVTLLCVTAGVSRAQPEVIPYHATYSETFRVYYREPGFSIEKVEGDQCLIANNRITNTINGVSSHSQKWAAYDSEGQVGYNDITTSVTILRDLPTGNRAVLSSMVEEMNTPTNGLRNIEKVAGIFDIDGVSHTIERTTKQGKDHYFDTSSTVVHPAERGFEPALALTVPTGEPTEIVGGMPCFNTEHRQVYTTPDRKQIIKIVSHVGKNSKIETSFNNFVPVGDQELPTEIEVKRLTNDRPVSVKWQSSIQYTLNSPVTIESLYAKAKSDKSLAWISSAEIE